MRHKIRLLPFVRFGVLSLIVLSQILENPKPAKAQTYDASFDLTVRNYQNLLADQARKQQEYEYCISQRNIYCSLPVNAADASMSMFYLTQIQNTLQFISQYTVENPQFCPTAANYFSDAYNVDPRLSIGVTVGGVLESFCLQQGYNNSFR